MFNTSLELGNIYASRKGLPNSYPINEKYVLLVDLAYFVGDFDQYIPLILASI